MTSAILQGVATGLSECILQNILMYENFQSTMLNKQPHTLAKPDANWQG